MNAKIKTPTQYAKWILKGIVRPIDKPSGQARVLAAIRRIRQGTDRDLAAAAGMELASAVKRRGELCARGLIEDSGDTALTPTGRLATVWAITAKGLSS